MKTVNMPVRRKAHQTQLPATPFLRTMSVTRLGVSVEKVVATMDTPSSHQGILRPDKKKSDELLPACFVQTTPMPSASAKNPKMKPQSNPVNCIIMLWLYVSLQLL